MNEDPLISATVNAVAYARERGDTEITPDDLLLGALQAVATLRVARFGSLAIDMAPFPPVPARGDESKTSPGYSAATASLFDQASTIAREDGEARVRIVHLLVALGDMRCDLMRSLEKRHAFDALAWRTALATWDHDQSAQAHAKSGVLMSVEGAASALGVHQQTIRGYIKSGKLPAFRIAGERAIRVFRSDLFELLEPLEPTASE